MFLELSHHLKLFSKFSHDFILVFFQTVPKIPYVDIDSWLLFYYVDPAGHRIHDTSQAKQTVYWYIMYFF